MNHAKACGYIRIAPEQENKKPKTPRKLRKTKNQKHQENYKRHLKHPKKLKAQDYSFLNMSSELDEIKQIRKKLGLTQTQLAKMAGVSQSLVAKIEAEKIDPTFSKAMQILTALKSMSDRKEKTAEEIMEKKIISVRPDSTIKSAISIMKKHEISQLPVIDDNNAVGHISESVLLDAIMNEKGELVRDIMKEAPPVLPQKSSVSVISDLLKFYSIILLSEKGRLMGLVTKSDIIRKLYR